MAGLHRQLGPAGEQGLRARGETRRGQEAELSVPSAKQETHPGGVSKVGEEKIMEAHDVGKIIVLKYTVVMYFANILASECNASSLTSEEEQEWVDKPLTKRS